MFFFLTYVSIPFLSNIFMDNYLADGFFSLSNVNCLRLLVVDCRGGSILTQCNPTGNLNTIDRHLNIQAIVVISIFKSLFSFERSRDVFFLYMLNNE